MFAWKQTDALEILAARDFYGYCGGRMIVVVARGAHGGWGRDEGVWKG